jgi:hypothetical protein
LALVWKKILAVSPEARQPGSFKKRGYVILIRQPAEKDLVL